MGIAYNCHILKGGKLETGSATCICACTQAHDSQAAVESSSHTSLQVSLWGGGRGVGTGHGDNVRKGHRLCRREGEQATSWGLHMPPEISAPTA